ncbi:hypothetical protein IE53DRAFT_409075 [Violaceomyces palustris]|uniref:Uncharacterized protein n=1 Tax=Violaceomyces palustris TaxID=1673888 RepID=A0ACD0P4D5_9BASI|nr:hypothetical protein IE53DRAFT_409075 [Violaceomyces palustris]
MPNFDLLEVDLIWPALQKAATEDPEFTSSNFDRAHVRIDSVRFKIVEELEEGILMSRKALEHHQLRICDDGDIVEMFSSENPLSRILLSKLMPGARVLTQAPPRIFRNGSESRANGDGNEQAQELPPTSKGTLEARKEDKLGPKHKEGGRKEVQEEREQMEHDNDDSGEEFPESLSLLDRISADQTVRSVSKPKPKAPSKDLTRKVHGSHTSPEDADTAKVAKGKRNAATGSFDANLYVLKDSSSLRSRISDNPSNSKRQRVALIPSDQNYGQNDHRKISNGSERRSIQTSGERWYQPKKFGTGEEAGEATRKWPHRDPRHAYSAYESVYVSEDPMDEESQLYRETSDLNPEEIKQASAKSRQILREMQQRRRLQAKAAAVPAERSDSPVPTDPVIPDGVCERGDPSSQYLRKQRDSSSSQERPPPPGPPPPKPFHRSPDWQGVRMPRTSEPRGSQASRHHGRSSTYSVSSSALRYGQRYDPSWSYRKDSLGAIDPDYYRTRNRQNSRNWQNANFYE